MLFKYHHTDEGFCRVCFTTQGAVNPKNTYYYCIQEDREYPKMFRCSCTSHDAPWEPEYPVSIDGEVSFDLPDDIDNYAQNIINEWKVHNEK